MPHAFRPANSKPFVEIVQKQQDSRYRGGYQSWKSSLLIHLALLLDFTNVCLVWPKPRRIGLAIHFDQPSDPYRERDLSEKTRPGATLDAHQNKTCHFHTCTAFRSQCSQPSTMIKLLSDLVQQVTQCVQLDFTTYFHPITPSLHQPQN
jgi:hypothetical protein